MFLISPCIYPLPSGRKRSSFSFFSFSLSLFRCRSFSVSFAFVFARCVSFYQITKRKGNDARPIQLSEVDEKKTRKKRWRWRWRHFFVSSFCFLGTSFLFLLNTMTLTFKFNWEFSFFRSFCVFLVKYLLQSGLVTSFYVFKSFQWCASPVHGKIIMYAQEEEQEQEKAANESSWGKKSIDDDDNDDDDVEEERHSLSHLLFYMHVWVHVLLWNWYRGQCSDGTYIHT